MKKRSSEVEVTLAPDLLERLRVESKALGVALEWLVASLVVDTLEPARSVVSAP